MGVELQGGGFHPLIPAGARPPTHGSAVVTTTHDQQTEVVIKALAQVGRGEPAHVLGSFALGGIAPTLTGVPQVQVTFELDEQRVLVVSAVDHASSNRGGLTIRDVV